VPDFIGGDPESNASECPAVFVIPETGDFVFRGKTITDPALITELNEHIGKAEDESDVWLPARMAPLIRDALDGYEHGRQGAGQHTFAGLLAATQASVIRFEMRDSYDQTEPGFAEWKATGDTGAYDWGDHLDVIRAAAARREDTPGPGRVGAPVGLPAVGARLRFTLAMHYNGTAWSIVKTVNTAEPTGLSGVTAISANNAWAVGNGFNNVHDTSASVANKAVIEHWNGTAWSIVASPAGLISVDRISAASATDIWAIGEALQTIGGNPVPVPRTLHWDGTAWSVAPEARSLRLAGDVLQAQLAVGNEPA
jgi:hypothetical protein